MGFLDQLVSIFSILGGGLTLVHATPFDGPAATPLIENFGVNGWTPRPTSVPGAGFELLKRQNDPSEDPAFCGYLEGDGALPITCQTGSSCMYNPYYSWFGCCTGTVIDDCNVITACVQSKSLDKCAQNPDCYADPLARFCTDSTAPQCLQLYTLISRTTYGHFECAATSTILQVLPTITNDASFPSTTPPSLDFSFSFTLPAGTETSEDSATTTGDDASSTRRRTTATSEDGGRSTGDRTATSTLDGSASRNAPSSTPPATSGTQNPAPAASSTAKAARAAEAMMGMAGLVAGLVAWSA